MRGSFTMKKHVGKMFHQQSLASVPILSALTPTFTLSAVFLIVLPVFAQSSAVSTSFPVPQSLPSGAEVQINGTTSMEKINQALAERFKAKFPDTNVKIGYDGTDASLKALADGKIDLAAIGRSLTEAQKARGLVSVPIARNKIAIILGKDNPYKNSLTSEQFAKIFRGEITNWSQVGGSPQAIRLIDRPENSDLRQAFQNYPVFKTAPFKTGANAIKLSEDSTEAVIKQLGANGIGYAIADQVINNPNVQIASLHNVPPTDARYPFSQPLGYVYQKPNTNPAAQAFLGYATAPENQRIVEEARTANGIATLEAASIPTTTTTATEAREEFPWWVLLLLPLLGGLLWWLLNRRTTHAAAPVAAPIRRPLESRLILTARNCRDAYAYWEVPDEVRQDLQRLGGRNLKLRLYDVTDIDMERQTPHSTKEFDCDERAQDIHIPIAVDNRDYMAELGYINNSGRWVTIARSAPVRVPECEPVNGISTTATSGVVANFLVSDRPLNTRDESRIILVPRNSRDAYAYWEVPEAHKLELQQQGGRKLALRVYDTTGIDLERQPAQSFRQFDCHESISDLHIPITESDREYVAELGYLTNDGRWLKLARSAPVEVPPTVLVDNTTDAEAVFERGDNISRAVTNVPNKVSEIIVGSTAARAFLNKEQPYLDSDGSRQAVMPKRTTDERSSMKSECRIILVPRNSEDAYVYWEISDGYKADARRQGGRRFVLRVHDVTNLDIDNQLPHSTQEYVCNERDQDKHVLIPASDRDYIAEVGYYTDDNRWLSIIRSFHVHVPSVNNS